MAGADIVLINPGDRKQAFQGLGACLDMRIFGTSVREYLVAMSAT